MGYWGWRRLIFFLFISVWVTGCRTAHETVSTITPTEYPPLTLIVRVPTLISTSTSTEPPPSPTPSPSQTKTARPTPVVYTVEAGDTLLGIAYQFGVSLEALQAANKNIAPPMLQIGQSLVIPNPQNTVDGFPILPTQTPPPLPLAPPTCYETRAGKLLCLGEVDNTLPDPLERVAVRVRLFTADEQLLGEETATVEQQHIRSGETAPYRVLFDTNGRKYAHTSATLVCAIVNPKADAHFLELIVEDETAAIQSNQMIISARLYNPGMETAEAVRLIATLYDETGNVIGYRTLQLDEALPPGKSLPVHLPVTFPTGTTVSTHTLSVEAHRQ